MAQNKLEWIKPDLGYIIFKIGFAVFEYGDC